MAEQTEVKTELTLSQRVQANHLLAADLKAVGLEAEAWVSGGAKPGSQVNVSKDGEQFMRITVSRAGFTQIRDYLTNTPPELLALVEKATGAKPNQFTNPVAQYAKGGNFRKFDITRISK